MKKFNKNKKIKDTIIISIILILVTIIGVDFIKSHAYFETSKTYNILKGRIPNFSGGDITLAVKVDEEKRDEFPEKGDYIVWSDCSNGMSVDWDYDAWNAKINNDITKPFACNMNFKSYDKFINTITYNGEKVDKYPDKGNLSVTVSCNNIDGKWNYDTWKPVLSGANKETVCDVTFEDVKELLVTREILDQGEFKNVIPEYITDGVNGTAGFTITGYSLVGFDLNGMISWRYLIDLTNYNYLKFYAKKAGGVGSVYIHVCPESDSYCSESVLNTFEDFDLSVHYKDLPTTWTEYTVDISKFNGKNYVYIIGGWGDGSGENWPGTATSYSNIRFTNE